MDINQEYSQAECKKYVRRYEKAAGKNSTFMLLGWLLADGRIKNLNGSITDIPAGYKQVLVSKESLESICPVPLDVAKIRKEKAISTSDWINKASAKHGLTIAFIKKLKVGEKVKVLMLDRNVFDTVSNHNTYGKVYSPTTFFKPSATTFTYLGDMKMRLDWFGTPVDMEFDVEYRKGNWYPLKDGVLPAKDSQGFFALLGKDTKWTEFPTKTKIGVRGPMILWSNVKGMPKVYYGENPW